MLHVFFASYLTQLGAGFEGAAVHSTDEHWRHSAEPRAETDQDHVQLKLKPTKNSKYNHNHRETIQGPTEERKRTKNKNSRFAHEIEADQLRFHPSRVKYMKLYDSIQSQIHETK